MTRLLSLGRRPYRETLETMRTLHAAVAAGAEPDTWILVEHEPVVTLGRNAKPGSVRLSEDALVARGVDLVRVERGGDATYHGPGQVVLYPVMRLARFREVVPLVAALERAAVAALATFGVEGTTRPEHRGVYVRDRGIAAVGLAVKSMTSLHGLSLNVTNALDYDRLIDPCGEPQFGITSIARETGRDVTWHGAARALLSSVEAEFALAFERETAVP